MILFLDLEPAGYDLRVKGQPRDMTGEGSSVDILVFNGAPRSCWGGYSI